MKERPILFSGPMVQAILEGRKTQTRRIVKIPASVAKLRWELTRMQEGYPDGVRPIFGDQSEPNCFSVRNPFGAPGTKLWVRETWHPEKSHHGPASYRANWKDEPPDEGWKPSIHMPRWASRITLENEVVRVERLNDISEEDAIAEGILTFTKDGQLKKYWPCDPCEGPLKCAWQDLPSSPIAAYRALWESLSGPSSWHANPYVWAITFKRIKP